MQIIKQTYHIKGTATVVWQALVDPKIIAKWGGGPAKMDAKVGTKFSLWGGSVWGTNTKVVPEKELVQDWYSQEEPTWVKPSKVTFTLKETGNGVELELVHTDVPDTNVVDITDGWKRYYLGPLKEFVESTNK